jgi:hypothetical protein
MRSLTALLWGFPAELVKEIRKTVNFLMLLSFLMGASIGAGIVWGIIVYVSLSGA